MSGSGRNEQGQMDRPLDVCFVLPSFDVGGAERVVVNLANGLQRLGHLPRIVLTGAPGPLVSQLDTGVSVSALGRSRVRRALPGLVSLLRREPPDVIVSTHTHVNLALCAVRPLLPRRTLLVLREPTHTPVSFDGSSTRWRRRAQRHLYPRASLVIATSRPMLDDLRALTSAPLTLLHNPIDVEDIRHRVDGVSSASASSEQRTGGGTVLVAVGRISTQKSLPELIDAFARGAGSDDRLVLIGDGPELATIRADVAARGLAERVILRGALMDPWSEIARADAFVLASRHEGMPNAALEALALGIPVLATTDLDVLEGLRAASAPGAVTLVPREDFAAALGRVPSLPAVTTLPRPNLLPTEHALTAVTLHFAQLLQHTMSDATSAGGGA